MRQPIEMLMNELIARVRSDLAIQICGEDMGVREPGSRRSVNFLSLRNVAYARANAGMGIVFTNIPPNGQLVLEKWIAELRGA